MKGLKGSERRQDQSREAMETDAEASEEAFLLLTVDQVIKRLRLSRATIYRLIATEDLPTVRFGRARRVMLASLKHWVEKREQEQKEERG